MVVFNVLLNSCISQTIVNKRGFGGRSWKDVRIFRGEKLLMARMEDDGEEIRGWEAEELFQKQKWIWPDWI